MLLGLGGVPLVHRCTTGGLRLYLQHLPVLLVLLLQYLLLEVLLLFHLQHVLLQSELLDDVVLHLYGPGKHPGHVGQLSGLSLQYLDQGYSILKLAKTGVSFLAE